MIATKKHPQHLILPFRDLYCLTPQKRLYLSIKEPSFQQGRFLGEISEMVDFRAKKGQVLFQDGEDSVATVYLQRKEGDAKAWSNVFELSLESGRSWGDEIDLLYRHRTRPEFVVHISGFGYWGDSEYYRSEDGGMTWAPYDIKLEPKAQDYIREELPQD